MSVVLVRSTLRCCSRHRENRNLFVLIPTEQHVAVPRLCCLQLEDFEAAIEDCSAVLKKQPLHFIALLRRGQARLGCITAGPEGLQPDSSPERTASNYREACTDFASAVAVDPTAQRQLGRELRHACTEHTAKFYISP